MNYKMKIQYDGTRYYGWQRLDNKDTIQGKIESVLSKLYEHKIEIHGAGRTDAGVHAKGQIANFKAKPVRSCKEIISYLNKYLPEDIAVTDIWEEDDRFHSRLLAKEKIYCYRIHNSNVLDVFNRRFSYMVPEKLNIDEMKKGAEYLIGRHNFTSFCNNKNLKKSPVREIFSIDIEKVDSEIIITIRGDGFLYNMVRIITGTLIEIGHGKRSPEEIPLILNAQNRKKAGETAPPKGLCLMAVRY